MRPSIKEGAIGMLAGLSWIIVFFLILYIGGAAIDWTWRLFDTEEPGVFTLIIRGFVISFLSAAASIAVIGSIFSHYTNRYAAVVFALGVLAWCLLMAALVPTEAMNEAVLAGYFPVLLAAGPAFYFSYTVWKDF